jgi:hypothetical protein
LLELAAVSPEFGDAAKGALLMKLLPPQKEVRVYKDGFEGDDLLSRRKAGQCLSDLLERVEDPIVVAVDGPWGSGKSHFLKRWVGAHKEENGGVATTVYFDAFANDFLDDPLIGLTGAIGDRLPTGEERGKWDAAKRVVVRLAKPALRVAAAVATAGATEIAGPAMLDAALEAGGKQAEEAVTAFWKREDGRKAAMQQFRDSLSQLTECSLDGTGDSKPLIVVVDELDRCRPDYSLAVLEVIKHFFSVPRVHFVLGVNMVGLEHIVRARYGNSVNAVDYLKRFVSMSMTLPHLVDVAKGTQAPIVYFQSAAAQMGIDGAIVKEVARQLNLSVGPAQISLRDVEKILTRLVLLPRRKELSEYRLGYISLILSLVIIRTVRADLYVSAINRTLDIGKIDGFYGFVPDMTERNPERPGSYNHAAYILRGLWLFALSGGTQPERDNGKFAEAFDIFETEEASAILFNIDRDFFGLFEVAD